MSKVCLDVPIAISDQEISIACIILHPQYLGNGDVGACVIIAENCQNDGLGSVLWAEMLRLSSGRVFLTFRTISTADVTLPGSILLLSGRSVVVSERRWRHQ